MAPINVVYALKREKKKSLFVFTIFKYGFGSLSLVVSVWTTLHVVFLSFALFVLSPSKHLDMIERLMVRVGWMHLLLPVRRLSSQPALL